MFLMKNKIFLWLTGCLALTLVSCLGNNEWDDVPYEVDMNCQILSFSVESDSLPALNDVRFTIDQINEHIMNLDSMDFGTVIEDKVIATIERGNYVSKIQVIPEATGDTIDWATRWISPNRYRSLSTMPEEPSSARMTCGSISIR